MRTSSDMIAAMTFGLGILGGCGGDPPRPPVHDLGASVPAPNSNGQGTASGGNGAQPVQASQPGQPGQPGGR